MPDFEERHHEVDLLVPRFGEQTPNARLSRLCRCPPAGLKRAPLPIRVPLAQPCLCPVVCPVLQAACQYLVPSCSEVVLNTGEHTLR